MDRDGATSQFEHRLIRVNHTISSVTDLCEYRQDLSGSDRLPRKEGQLFTCALAYWENVL